MESIIQNPTLAFIAVIVTALLASSPGLYAAWTQRKRIKAETVKEDAEAAEIISKAYTQLQASYVSMIDAIKENYAECSEKMEALTVEVKELRKENAHLLKENAALRKQVRKLETQIEELINGK